jgi:hypothetical protein
MQRTTRIKERAGACFDECQSADATMETDAKIKKNEIQGKFIAAPQLRDRFIPEISKTPKSSTLLCNIFSVKCN